MRRARENYVEDVEDLRGLLARLSKMLNAIYHVYPDVFDVCKSSKAHHLCAHHGADDDLLRVGSLAVGCTGWYVRS